MRFLSLLPNKKDLTQGLSYRRGLGRSEASPAGRMQVIGSLSAMWARWASCWTWTYSIYNVSPACMPAHGLNHQTRESSAMQSFQWRHHPPAGGLAEAGGYSASNLSLTLRNGRTDTSTPGTKPVHFLIEQTWFFRLRTVRKTLNQEYSLYHVLFMMEGLGKHKVLLFALLVQGKQFHLI